mgnify:CR=1 FL=1
MAKLLTVLVEDDKAPVVAALVQSAIVQRLAEAEVEVDLGAFTIQMIDQPEEVTP